MASLTIEARLNGSLTIEAGGLKPRPGSRKTTILCGCDVLHLRTHRNERDLGAPPRDRLPSMAAACSSRATVSLLAAGAQPSLNDD